MKPEKHKARKSSRRLPLPEALLRPMRIFVSGNDTGIGKTRVCSYICSLFAQTEKLLYLKPIETGIDSPEDEKIVRHATPDCSTQTLRLFSHALAPTEAAKREGQTISFGNLTKDATERIGDYTCSVIEGAGGLATPVDENGHDWLDFANSLKVDFLVLVIEDRLGAINQGRLLLSHLNSTSIQSGIWLNETKPQSAEIRQSNLSGLSSGPIPIWAVQEYEKKEPRFTCFPWT